MLKYLIPAIVIPLVMYYATNQNRDFENSILNASKEEVLDQKQKWAYNFWKTRTKHFLITIALGVIGIIIFTVSLAYSWAEYISYLGIAIFLSGFIYMMMTIGLKNARYDLIMREFERKGISKKSLVAEFKKWKNKGL